LIRFDVINNCTYGARIVVYIYSQVLNFESNDNLIKILFSCETRAVLI